MMNLRGAVVGIVCLNFMGLTASHVAVAMTGPSSIQIDGGALGDLEVSAGLDGDAYAVSNAAPGAKSTGAQLGNALIELQKTSGILQFTIEVGSYSTQTLGYAPATASGISPNYFPESPLYAGYITIAPNSAVSVSLGQISPIVGYEASQDWGNANIFFSEIAYTQPAQGRGGNIALTQGPFSATVSLTDGYYTGVMNYLQWLLTYGPDSDNSLSLYGGANLGRTGENVGGIANPLLDNSDMYGAFYTYTTENLTMTPEVQYQTTPPIAAFSINHRVSNLALALFADEQLGSNTPWSLGAFVEYATQFYNKADDAGASEDFFGFGPGSNLYGISITPTWQSKNLFARADMGLIHVNRGLGGSAFDDASTANQFSGLLEAGLLF